MTSRNGTDFLGCIWEGGQAAMRADSGGRFRMLQVTDFHSDAGDAAAEQTHAAVRTMVARFNPDLIAVTGDIWCADEQPERAELLMIRDLAFLAELGVPWAFTWGNHDAMPGGFAACQARIAAVPGAIMPAGDSRGNYRIEVRDSGGFTPVFDVFFLNTHERSMTEADAEWFRSEAHRLIHERRAHVPAVAFFHVPIKAYEDARLSSAFAGIGPEPLGEWGDDGRIFPMLCEPGVLRACFVGHCHRNDFHAHADGVLLAYGRATGYGGYGGEDLPKGAKLITLDTRHGTLTAQTVFPTGQTWRPG